MARTKTKAENGNGATLGFEAKLWQAADKLRNNMDAAEYSLHGDPQEPWNQRIVSQADALGRSRSERYPLTIQFFDAASAHVWG
jgi:hypothetical protein